MNSIRASLQLAFKKEKKNLQNIDSICIYVCFVLCTILSSGIGMINNTGGRNFYVSCVKTDFNGSGNNSIFLNFRKNTNYKGPLGHHCVVRLVNMMDLCRCITCISQYLYHIGKLMN